MERKYELTGTIKKYDNCVLYRIRAVRDFSNVRAKQYGGWIESEENLSHEGECWVADEAMVYDHALVYGDAKVRDNARVCGNAWVYDNAKVFGDAEVRDSAKVYGNALVYGNAKVCHNAMVYGCARIMGSSCVSDNAKVHENARIMEMAYIYGKADVFEFSAIGGNARIYGDAKVCGNARIFDNASLCDGKITDNKHYMCFHNVYFPDIGRNTFTYNCTTRGWIGLYWDVAFTPEQAVARAHGKSEEFGKFFDDIAKVAENVQKLYQKEEEN